MKKVLVVDDEHDIREILDDYLTACNMSVRTAENGQVAMSVFEEFKPDLAVVDIQMAVMGGIEFSKKIIAENPDFPIVMITGYYNEYDISEILSIGVKEVVKKPLHLNKFYNSLQKYFT
jgi:two-component system, chemotaxis family, chemotaxis protein CheY